MDGVKAVATMRPEVKGMLAGSGIVIGSINRRDPFPMVVSCGIETGIYVQYSKILNQLHKNEVPSEEGLDLQK